MSNLDPDSDIYGRHAAGPDRPVGLPARWEGREVRLPWSVVVDPDAKPGRHRPTWENPAGMHFERAGVRHHELFSVYRPGYVLDRVTRLLRHGEKPLKKLTSRM